MVEDTSVLTLGARLGMSFIVILGLLGIVVWVLRRRGGLRGARGARRRIELLDRVQLSRGASIAVVRVGARSLLVGSTDTKVTFLGDATEDLAGLDEEIERAKSATPAQWTGSRPGGAHPVRSRTGMIETLREWTTRRT